MDKAVREVKKYVLNHRAEMIEYLKELVLAESPSTQPASQHRMLELLAEPVRSIGFKTHLLRGRKSGGELFARPTDHQRGTSCQLLLGHSDTVWPVGTLQTMPLEIDDNIMRGPGVYDMKAGLCQIVYALKALYDLGVRPALSPVIYICSDEELGSEDSRSRIQLLARRVKRVFVPEPSSGEDGHLKTARKGVGVFTIDVTGRSAHAGVEPEAGVSAVLELSEIILRLDSLNDRLRGITVTTGTVQGGTRSNVVPAHATASVDVRVQTAEDGQEIEDLIRGLKPSRTGISLQVEGGMDRPPLEATPRNQDLWTLAQEAGHRLNLNLRQSSSGGGSDGSLTSPFTATLDGLGGVGGGAHARHEFIYIDRLLERTALLALLIASPDISRPAR